MVFFHEMAAHPSALVCNHFKPLGKDYFLQRMTSKSLILLLSEADQLHMLLTSAALPYASTKSDSSPTSISSQDILAMVSVIKSNQAAMKSAMGLVANHENCFLQLKGSPSAKSSPPCGHAMSKGLIPPWHMEKPDDVSEECTFNNCPWTWCQKCNDGKGQWSLMHTTDQHGQKNGNKLIKCSKPSSSTSTTSSTSLTKKMTPSMATKSLKAFKADFSQNATLLELIQKKASSSDMKV